MTKQEKREKINELLRWYKGLEDQDINTAKFIIAQGGQPDEVLANRMKFGRYFPIKDLWDTIGSAMEFELLAWRDHEDELDGLFDVPDGCFRINHHYRVLYKSVGYRKADFRVIQTVIDRMAEQGYIKVSKSGRGFRVLKVD